MDQIGGYLDYSTCYLVVITCAQRYTASVASCVSVCSALLCGMARHSGISHSNLPQFLKFGWQSSIRFVSRTAVLGTMLAILQRQCACQGKRDFPVASNQQSKVPPFQIDVRPNLLQPVTDVPTWRFLRRNPGYVSGRYRYNPIFLIHRD